MYSFLYNYNILALFIMLFV